MQRLMTTLDPLYLASYYFRTHQLDACIASCDVCLDQNARDEAAWYLKCRAITRSCHISDLDIDDDAFEDTLLEENPTNTMSSRAGTSLRNTRESTQSKTRRAVTGEMVGYERPGTTQRGLRTTNNGNHTAKHRLVTARPVTSSGKFVRLGTASIAQSNSTAFLNAQQLDISKFQSRPAIAKVAVDYFLYVDGNPKVALEIAALFTGWWWKARLGKSYYRLGLCRESEKQFKASIVLQNMPVTTCELAKVYLRLDQPTTALECLQSALDFNGKNLTLLTGMARIHTTLGDTETAVRYYKKCLQADSCGIEAMASIASYYFYHHVPEIALRYYRRILQMGYHTCATWNNLGLCCFYSSQLDLALSCFERALQSGTEISLACVWYNMAHVGISAGDLNLAYQALKVATSLDGAHAEAHCNLGVIEMRNGNLEQAQSCFQAAILIDDALFEPQYNLGVLGYRTGDYQAGYRHTCVALSLCPDHTDANELKLRLDNFLRAI